MPYGQGLEMREGTSKHIREQLQAGVIKPTKSEWASRMVLVPRKEGKLRFCVEYIILQLATVVDYYPMPR